MDLPQHEAQMCGAALLAAVLTQGGVARFRGHCQESLDKVERLLGDEYLMQAHEEYVSLCTYFTTVLKAAKISVILSTSDVGEIPKTKFETTCRADYLLQSLEPKTVRKQAKQDAGVRRTSIFSFFSTSSVSDYEEEQPDESVPVTCAYPEAVSLIPKSSDADCESDAWLTSIVPGDRSNEELLKAYLLDQCPVVVFSRKPASTSTMHPRLKKAADSEATESHSGSLSVGAIDAIHNQLHSTGRGVSLPDFLQLPVVLNVHCVLKSTSKTENVSVNSAGEAWGVADWFMSWICRLVNNPHIHRLRWSYYKGTRALRIVDTIPVKAVSLGWLHVNRPTFDIWWQMGAGDAVAVIVGRVHSSFKDLLSLLYEVDLHSTWIPFLKESRRLCEFVTTCQLAQHETNFPWPLPNRKSILLASAIDALHVEDNPWLVVCGSSAPSEAQSVFGVPVRRYDATEKAGVRRINMEYFCFCVRPTAIGNEQEGEMVEVSLILRLDPEMPTLPRTLQTFIVQRVAERMFETMEAMVRSGVSEEHQKCMVANRDTYDLIETRVADYKLRSIKRPLKESMGTQE